MQFKKFFIGLFIILLFGLEIVVKSGHLSPIFLQLLFNKNIELRKSEPSRINILLLGRGGGTHEGPNLSDTIIFASLDLKSPKIILVSLPRDIWVSEIDAKINTAYAKGESKRKGGGLILAKSVVAKITGQNIDYGVVIDFSGFEKAIDVLGGLDINVDRTFDDFEYPIEGKEDDPCGNKEEDLEKLATASSQLEAFPCRYEHLHFEKGKNHMNGKTALKFVRSRHAKGAEGTDFARSQRQEKVIEALKNNVFSLQILNPARMLGLYSTLEESIDTDIKTNEFDDFIKVGQKLKNAEIQSVVVDNGDLKDSRGGLLTHPDITEAYNYEWVLIPRTGKDNYSEINEYIRCRLTQEECIISQIP